MCSDGVTDAQSVEGEEFGEERLARIAVDSKDEAASAIVDRVIDAIDRFAGAAPQFDDITLLVVKRTR